ncbi:hypothetical protein [Derxia gummosa]|uniref:PEP-CTERM protein-sorting domain-containing protein n=1 Tax=Derxia gummosa DSM 723 TaxID=1121388 RepID=A0A8B6X4L4_9BURK|nr:hypothetical protein [Derxia gummosa]
MPLRPCHACALLALLGPPAGAAVVTIDEDAIITSSTGPTSNLFDIQPVGTELRLHIEIDLASLGSAAVDANGFTAAAGRFTLSDGTSMRWDCATATGCNTPGYSLWPSYTSSLALRVPVRTGGYDFAGTELVAQWRVSQPGPEGFSQSGALSNVGRTLSEAQEYSELYGALRASSTAQITSVTVLSPVPEAGTGASLIAGLALLAVVARSGCRRGGRALIAGA